MRKLILVALLGAVPSASEAAPCLVGTLDTYIALGAGGCTIGGATVADFDATSLLFGATPIPPTSVTVIPSASARRLVLDFDLLAPFEVAGAGDLLDILIHYTVSGGPFRENFQELTGASAAGDGVVTGVEEKCVGALFDFPFPPSPCGGTPTTTITLQSDIISIPKEGVSFGFDSFFDVFFTLTLDGGVSGSAGVAGTARNAFAPEPSALLVVGCGLFAYLTRRKRRRP